MSKNIEGVGEVATPSTFKEKLQNFIYHYKWHTVVALFLVVTIIICSLQFCTKEEYDAHILYIGGKSIGRTAENGDVAEIVTVISSLKQVTDDFDKSGQISVDFTSYYFLSSAESEALDDVNEALLATDKEAIPGVLQHSEYYLCLISPSAYEQYHLVGDTERFLSLEELGADHPETEFYTPYAIYLASTPAYKLPGLSVLPADTLICIRRPSTIGGKSKEHLKYVENAKTIIENMLGLQ